MRALFVCGVHDKFMCGFVTTDAHAGKGSFEGNATYFECSGSTHNADRVDRICLIGNQRHRNDLNFVSKTIGERRTNGAIDHTRGKRRLFAGTCFTLEISSWNAANRIHFFDKVHGKWEKVVVFAFFRNDYRDINT